MAVKLILPKKKSITVDENSTNKVCYNLYYHKLWIVRKVFKKRLNETLKLVKKKKYNLALDIGTGTGIILPTLSNISNKVIGFELQNENLDNIKETCEKEKLLNVDIMPMGYDFKGIKLKDKSADLIFCLSVIEHCKDLEFAVKELRRLLSDDGILVISYPIEEFITEFIYKLLGLKEVNEEHHYSNYKQIRFALKKKFKIVKKKRLPINFLPNIFSNYEILICKTTT